MLSISEATNENCNFCISHSSGSTQVKAVHIARCRQQCDAMRCNNARCHIMRCARNSVTFYRSSCSSRSFPDSLRFLKIYTKEFKAVRTAMPHNTDMVMQCDAKFWQCSASPECITQKGAHTDLLTAREREKPV